ncbi:tRNA-uridine aminocarboxypropyltransferase [Alteromonas lipotrueiana]|uniref:tRNA-uridine aminocarboxypropyltransferase n=1 Tax=Alteromonas lipotrueiana TaxID=2803815 RepID=UPI001C47A2B0|nr:tRNA-uridine aminocarboxypropyltransferase [Alteromonas lipotrueiana]
MRRYCSHCHFPVSTCVCNQVIPIKSPVRFIILQHHKEAGHAKNTARLIPLVIPDTLIVTGNSEEDFLPAKQLASQYRCGLLYPGSHSQPIESETFANERPRQLVLLDGSWRQAYGLFQKLEWLRALPAWHFSQAPSSAYRIRHTEKSYSLSTLEAAAYSLKQGYQCNSDPLLRLQESMQSFWQGPAAHWRR